MVEIKYIKRKRSGFKSMGVEPMPPPVHEVHIERVLWLAAQLEMPTGYGSIQNCHDAAAMSAGLLHHIAVVPKQMAQGSLWKLLNLMQATASLPTQELVMSLNDLGWVLGRDGNLRSEANGTLISGRDITRILTSSEDGNVPEPGQLGHDEARVWARKFAEAFADPLTYGVQRAFAAEWLLKSHLGLESQAYSRMLESKISSVEAAHIHIAGPADLAMAVYHAFSANAPAVAREVLTQVLAKPSLKGNDFCSELIYRLGTKKYKNWADKIDDRSRYDRTRDAARRLWPEDLFDYLMPENIKRKR